MIYWKDSEYDCEANLATTDAITNSMISAARINEAHSYVNVVPYIELFWNELFSTHWGMYIHEFVALPSNKRVAKPLFAIKRYVALFIYLQLWLFSTDIDTFRFSTWRSRSVAISYRVVLYSPLPTPSLQLSSLLRQCNK